MEAIRNSFFMRLLSPLAPVGRFFKTAFKESGVLRSKAAMERAYDNSRTASLWIAFGETKDAAETSKYKAFLLWVERGLVHIGDVLRVSLFYKALTSIKNLYFRVTKGSLVFERVNSIPLHRWLLMAFTLYLPIEYALRDVLDLGLLSSVWEELFIAVGVFTVLWRTMLKQGRGFARATTVEAFMLLFMAVGLLLMMINRPFPSVALPGYRAVVEYMLWFFIIMRLVEDKDDARALVYCFTAVVFALCLHGIYQYIVKVPIPDAWTSNTEMGVRTRVFSITGSPNIFGSLIVLAAPIMASLIYYCKRPFWKLFFLGCTGLMCLCLLFTFSRGAWVGIVLAVILFALYVDKRLLGIMGAAIAGVLVAVPSITSRLTYLFTTDYVEASAIGGRALRWEVGRNLLLENSPWLGFGLGRFGGAVAMNNQLLDKTEEFSYFYMDNYYLKTLVEMGYIGLIFFLLLIAALIVWGLRAIYKSDSGALPNRALDPVLRNVGNDKLICVGIFSGMCGVLTHCYFENIFEEPYMMSYFWGLAAVLMVLGFFCKDSVSAGDPAHEGPAAENPHEA